MWSTLANRTSSYSIGDYGCYTCTLYLNIVSTDSEDTKKLPPAICPRYIVVSYCIFPEYYLTDFLLSQSFHFPHHQSVFSNIVSTSLVSLETSDLRRFFLHSHAPSFLIPTPVAITCCEARLCPPISRTHFGGRQHHVHHFCPRS